MIPLYIFDLDGTLADIRHRRHFVEKPNSDWDSFHRSCVADTPIVKVIEIFEMVRHAGYEAWIFSGRDDMVRYETEQWLMLNTSIKSWELPNIMRMREHGDNTPDDVLKASWLYEMSEYDRARLRMVFDDRNRVVAMWRRNGVSCCQVEDGDF